MVAHIFTLLLACFAFKFVNYSRHIKILNFRKTAILPFSCIFQRLAVPQIVDQFGLKTCQKKRKDVRYKLLWEFFQKYFVVHERSAVKYSFSTYVWSRVDSCFCEFLYITKEKRHGPHTAFGSLIVPRFRKLLWNFANCKWLIIVYVIFNLWFW